VSTGTNVNKIVVEYIDGKNRVTATDMKQYRTKHRPAKHFLEEGFNLYMRCQSEIKIDPSLIGYGKSYMVTIYTTKGKIIWWC